MNLVKWILNKKIIESEIESGDKQYETTLIKNGKLRKENENLKKENEILEEKNMQRLETISELRKKVNSLKRELKKKEVM